jgi:hypothetical protein
MGREGVGSNTYWAVVLLTELRHFFFLP